MDSISVLQAAERWGVSAKRVQVLCKAGRIPGVIRAGRCYRIPACAEKPADARVRSGRYIGAPRRTPGLHPPDGSAPVRRGTTAAHAAKSAESAS